MVTLIVLYNLVNGSEDIQLLPNGKALITSVCTNLSFFVELVKGKLNPVLRFNQNAEILRRHLHRNKYIQTDF